MGWCVVISCLVLCMSAVALRALLMVTSMALITLIVVTLVLFVRTGGIRIMIRLGVSLVSRLVIRWRNRLVSSALDLCLVVVVKSTSVRPGRICDW